MLCARKVGQVGSSQVKLGQVWLRHIDTRFIDTKGYEDTKIHRYNTQRNQKENSTPLHWQGQIRFSWLHQAERKHKDTYNTHSKKRQGK